MRRTTDASVSGVQKTVELPQVHYTETIIDVIVVLQHRAQTIQRVQMMDSSESLF